MSRSHEYSNDTRSPQVSVPQSELLSLISAAKSLGIRGLAEDSGPGDQGEERRGERGGLKREGEPDTEEVTTKRSRVYPKLQHKLANKPWSHQDTLSR